VTTVLEPRPAPAPEPPSEVPQGDEPTLAPPGVPPGSSPAIVSVPDTSPAPATVPVPRIGSAPDGPPGAGADRPPDQHPTELSAAVQPAVDAEGRVRLYIWQAPVRLTHWVTAFAIVILSLTGIYIADPFLIPPGGSTMTIVRLIHIGAALTLVVSVAVRVAWAFFGNRWARWYAFVPTNRYQATEVFRQAGFYLFLRREIPKVLGHNQLAAGAYLVLYALLGVEIVTGFALDGLLGSEPGATGFGWLRDLVGPQVIRLVHHFSMWAILAIALFHVYSCVLVDNLEKNGLMSSIFSGFKYVTPEEIAESRDGGSAVIEEAR
jgi:Ni/Fe-hydrogenase 1 B-type cytochrome subunit